MTFINFCTVVLRRWLIMKLYIVQKYSYATLTILVNNNNNNTLTPSEGSRRNVRRWSRARAGLIGLIIIMCDVADRCSQQMPAVRLLLRGRKIFTARRICITRYMLWCSVSLSVCHTGGVLCRKN